jgi:hypothetical protein
MRERRNFITVIKGLKDLLDLMKRAFSLYSIRNIYRSILQSGKSRFRQVPHGLSPGEIGCSAGGTEGNGTFRRLLAF